MSDIYTEMLRDLNHAPTLTGNAKQRALQGNLDAAALATDIRDLDPRQLWGRVYRWLEENPQRVAAALISLAAMAEPHARGGSPDWTRGFGGTAALHPDYTSSARVPMAVEEHREMIVDLARNSDLTDHEIARRLGVSVKSVALVRVDAGVARPRGPVVGRDKRIAELAEAGMSNVGISEVVGCAVRTVERARARLAGAAENAA